MTILRVTNPKAKNMMMGWTETAFGIGTCLGPPLGGLLYEKGGFSLPFWTVGGLAIMQTLTLILAIPTSCIPDTPTESRLPLNQEGKSCPPALTVKDVLTSPRILVPYWDLFASYLGYGLINSMLGEYMFKEMKANELQVGVTFTVLGLTYVCGALMAGWVSSFIEVLK